MILGQSHLRCGASSSNSPVIESYFFTQLLFQIIIACLKFECDLGLKMFRVVRTA